MDTRKITTAFPLILIRIYQLLSAGLPHRCRFFPSCSQYAADALKSKGLFSGLGLAAKRILKCHPWHRGGYDPVSI